MAYSHRIDAGKLRHLRAECGDCGGELTDSSLLAALAGAGDLRHAAGDVLPRDGVEILKNRDGAPIMHRFCAGATSHDGDCGWGPTSRIAA